MRRSGAGLTALCLFAVVACASSRDPAADALRERVARLAAEVQAAEDISAIKRLQRTYGYFLDKGMWTDLAEYFTDDAVASYPAGIFVDRASIREHLYRNVGGVPVGQVGLGDGRLYNHMSIQPVVHLDAGGRTAKARWRTLAMSGSFGGTAAWAEGVYEMEYRKEDGTWKIAKLDYHPGFRASYATGWVAPERPSGAAPGSARGGRVWGDLEPAWAAAQFSGIDQLARRAERLQDEQQIENLQRIYGYYLDRAQWDQVADLFADSGAIEFAQQGIYTGKRRIREFLSTLGPHGLTAGWLNDRLQMQPVVTVIEDRVTGVVTARVRSRELGMTGHVGGKGQWSEGIYENWLVKEGGVWKFTLVRFHPTFISDYDRGWAKDAQPAPGVLASLPPDAPPSERYEIFPKAHIPPYHYVNPVTRQPASYPRTPAGEAAARVEPVASPVMSWMPPAAHIVGDPLAALAEAERVVARVKDYHEIENLGSAYGYYLDRNLWNPLADLFAQDGSIELAQRGVYRGPRVREFLVKVFGRGQEGPVQGRLGNHIQEQPVIHVAADGRSAQVRSRMLQQMSMNGRASMGGAIYENELVKEEGVWKFRRVHAWNTFSAGYDGGWARNTSRNMPGPSADFPPDAPPTASIAMLPIVYEIPYHYANPVSGRTVLPPLPAMAQQAAQFPAAAPAPGPPPAGPAQVPGSVAGQALITPPAGAGGRPPGMPAEIAAGLREIGARVDGARTAALYAPLHAPLRHEGVELRRDLAYGPDERHRADVFLPRAAGNAPRPVLVFIYGGGFRGGAKNTAGSPFYDNIGYWAASQGLVGVTINYRLAPPFTWPAGAEDVARAVTWLRSQAASWGADPAQIFLWGHSSGASHTAEYLVRNADAPVKAAVLMSGIYTPSATWAHYFGEDASQYPARVSLPRLIDLRLPLMVVWGELDPPDFLPDTEQLVAGRRAAGRTVVPLRLPGHSHLSEAYAVGTADESLTAPLLQFIRSTPR